MACHMAKFHGLTPSTPKFIGEDTLTFKPILHPSLKAVVRGTPVPSGGCGVLVRLGHSLACVNIWGLGAEVWSSEKVDLGGHYLPSTPLLLVDQSSPGFLLNAGEIAVDQVLVRFRRSSSVSEIFTVKLWTGFLQVRENWKMSGTVTEKYYFWKVRENGLGSYRLQITDFCISKY